MFADPIRRRLSYIFAMVSLEADPVATGVTVGAVVALAILYMARLGGRR
jgi:hypothetical protein